MRLRLITFGAGALLATACARAAAFDPHDVFDDDFQRLVEDLLEEHHAPGISIAIIKDGAIASQGYGYSSLPDTPANGDTLWLTGSTTKAFVAAAAAKIVMNNTAWPDVQWDTPLSTLLPGDFVLYDDWTTSHITLEDALSHRTGLPRHDVSYGWAQNGSGLDTVRLLRHLPPTAAPRTRYQYNNMMYSAAGVALEAVTGQPIGDLLRDWLWHPLGMRSTRWTLDEAERLVDEHGRKRLAHGYFWTGDHYVPNPYLDFTAMAAAGATISSVNDYALWVRALLATYAENSTTANNASSPINAALMEQVTTARTMITDSGVPRGGLSAYALGWIVEQAGAHPRVSHTGGVPGFMTLVSMLPYAGFGFVSVENTYINSTAEAILVGDLVWAALLERLGFVSKDESAPIAIELSPPTTTNHHHGQSDVKTLPSTLEDYPGTYFHPGYGAVKVSLDSASEFAKASPQGEPQHPFRAADVNSPGLQVEFSSRSWPIAIQFVHFTGDMFNSTLYRLYGTEDPNFGACGPFGASGTKPRTTKRNLDCRYEIAYDPSVIGQAVFERGLDGEVDRLGIHVEANMVDAAVGGDWRDGMIWFSRT